MVGSEELFRALLVDSGNYFKKKSLKIVLYFLSNLNYIKVQLVHCNTRIVWNYERLKMTVRTLKKCHEVCLPNGGYSFSANSQPCALFTTGADINIGKSRVGGSKNTRPPRTQQRQPENLRKLSKSIRGGRGITPTTNRLLTHLLVNK